MRKILYFISSHFIIFLFLYTLLSYGQLIWMQPWQEDNVIFFKVTHIDERAGYLGEGVFGKGTYRNIITPYYLLYQLAGYNTYAFFGLAWFFIFSAAVAIYYMLKELLNKTVAMLGSLVFASGYVAFDGFTRVYNSISTSLGIIFISLTFIFYWRYFKTSRVLWYILTVLFYYFTIELSYIRSHYLIFPIIIFELVIFTTPVSFKKLAASALRITPFLFIFYKLYIQAGDNRNASTLTLAKSIFTGNFENTFSFFSTLGNLILIDKIQALINKLVSAIPLLQTKSLLFSQLIILGLFLIIVYKLSKSLKYQKLFLLLNLFLGFIWLYISNTIFSKPTLIYSTPQTILSAFIGGLAFPLLGALLLYLQKNYRKLTIVFSVLIIANIAAYAAYTPQTPYLTGYRYMAHSFVGFISILCIFASSSIQRKSFINIPALALISFSLILLILGTTNLNYLLEYRSKRIHSFYSQLKTQVPNFPKGSIIYFDIEDSPEARSWFSVSFSVAEMPNTTAIAWRYGIDRYDIKMFTDFSETVEEIKKTNTPLSKVYTFWLSKNSLKNTSESFRQLAVNSSNPQLYPNINLSSIPVIKKGKNGSLVTQPDIIVDLPQPIISLTPAKLELTFKAIRLDTSNLAFPLQISDNDNPIYLDPNLRALSFNYKKERENISKEASFSATSSWKDRIVEHLYDNNPQTFWQADRLLWAKQKTFITIDTKKLAPLSGLVWQNGRGENTPINYNIQVSSDGQNWETVNQVSGTKRIDTQDLQIIKFPKKQAQYIRMNILKTLGGDSPIIAEIFPLSSEFENLDLKNATQFLANPFNLITNPQSFNDDFISQNQTGTIQIYWWGDKSSNWTTNPKSTLPITYNQQSNTYSFYTPAAGTHISKLKISNITIPGTIILENLMIQNLPITTSSSYAPSP